MSNIFLCRVARKRLIRSVLFMCYNLSTSCKHIPVSPPRKGTESSHAAANAAGRNYDLHSFIRADDAKDPGLRPYLAAVGEETQLSPEASLEGFG